MPCHWWAPGNNIWLDFCVKSSSRINHKPKEGRKPSDYLRVLHFRRSSFCFNHQLWYVSCVWTSRPLITNLYEIDFNIIDLSHIVVGRKLWSGKNSAMAVVSMLRNIGWQEIQKGGSSLPLVYFVWNACLSTVFFTCLSSRGVDSESLRQWYALICRVLKTTVLIKSLALPYCPYKLGWTLYTFDRLHIVQQVPETGLRLSCILVGCYFLLLYWGFIFLNIHGQNNRVKCFWDSDVFRCEVTCNPQGNLFLQMWGQVLPEGSWSVPPPCQTNFGVLRNVRLRSLFKEELYFNRRHISHYDRLMNGNKWTNTRIQTDSTTLRNIFKCTDIFILKNEMVEICDHISKQCAMEILGTCLAWPSSIVRCVKSQTGFNWRKITENMDAYNDHWFSAHLHSVLCSPRAKSYSNCCALCRMSSPCFALIIVPSMASGNPFRSVRVMGSILSYW